MSTLIARPWQRRLACSVLVVTLLLGLAWWAVPWWVEGAGMRLASQALGREVSVQKVRFQPWRLGLILDGVEVAGTSPGDAALLEIASTEATLSLRSLWHRSPVLDSLHIERPLLRLSRVADGRYDVDDLLKRWSQPAQKAESESGASLALYNLSLAGGQVMLDDKPMGRRHELSDLHIDLPFVSLLDAHVEVHVEPRLSGRLNGVVFDSRAEALPFAKTRQAQLDFSLKDFDLEPYLAYWPRQLPLRPERGRLNAELQLLFSQTTGEAPELKLGGRIDADEVSVALGGHKSWLVWDRLQLALGDVQPLKKQVMLDTLVWTGPKLALQRDATGRLLLPQFAAAPPVKPVPETRPDVTSPWRFALRQFELRQAGLTWRDESLRPAAELGLSELGLKLNALSWPLRDKTGVSFEAKLDRLKDGKPAIVSGSGELTAEALSLTGQWQDLALEWFSPYLQAELPLAAQGRLAGQLRLDLAQPLVTDAGQRAKLAFKDLRLDALQVQQLSAAGRRQELLSLAGLSLDELLVEPAERRLSLGRLGLREPRLALQRSADGVLSVLALMPAKSAQPSVPWSAELAELAIDGGALRFSDAAVQPLAGVPGQPHLLVLEQLRLRAQQLGRARSPLQLSAQLGRPAGGQRRRGGATTAMLGKLQWQGELAMSPQPSVRGSLRAERLPLQLLDPYLDPALGLHLRRAEAGFRGTLALAQGPQGLVAQAQGDLLLADLRLLHTRTEGDGARRIDEELLNWQALNLAGIKLDLRPAGPLKLDIGEASLSDFYARLIIDEQGRFNLGERAPKPTADATASTAAGPGLQLQIGQTRLAGGSVDFSDRFVKPNYSAKLSELRGSLGDFASDQAQMAPLNLSGKVAGTGLLEIKGELNPAGTPLLMDIQASATDIELAPLSPYAGKYAGYAIDRGKLSTRVHYRIAPGGALQADNQLVLNQLTFGERIDSPEATKLPVLLAVALLKDSNGVIDLNLPVSGSLDDPEFSIGGLIFRLIVNLLGKALTSPFSLLAGGGSADLSQAEFRPGSSGLADSAPANLDKLAKALADRPSLNLTLTGWADPAAERAAVQAAKVEQSLQAERRRELRRQQNASGQAAAEAGAFQLSEADRLRLLRVVYQASSLPNRPRNLVGMLKDVPPSEMQAMLAASHEVSEEALRQLALERAVVVRDALIAKGVPNARLFLASPKLHAAEAGKTWTPHVELALATQ
ncbi:DUF748 domain-containing protein [Paucibacter sp. PLA-PC-4]|uniref:DUF748 domain-containing protein n=1 Tax=Paucibacter sp. PLA-PC-4 TaxID=2993655 RepID=UPI0022489344|nr:DUF748 domain-containing protein [Paucibacter sp. PLA-PC-4]MCX2861775.1 DUF748 domain-containing protein [Paucibacter sp. PLA-PC-4]